MKNANAFKAIVTLNTSGFLLGGIRKHVSSAFAEEQIALDFALQSVEVNKNRAGYHDANITFEIVPVYSKNPIR
jgi:hypothetical protein